MVNQHERAGKVWGVLVEGASKRKLLTYKDLSTAVGFHYRTLRFPLELIQSYCIQQKLPPLTILVVNTGTSLPGAGFIAWDRDDLDEGKQTVFDYKWKLRQNPFSFTEGGFDYSELLEQILANPDKSRDVYRLVKDRGVAQQIFRDALLRAYGVKCSFTGVSFKCTLDAAHIIPWSQCSAKYKTDPRNGILLLASHHRLFDQKRITVDERFRIICEPSILSRTGIDPVGDSLTKSLHGEKMRLPKSKNLWPSIDLISRRNQDIDWL